MQRITWLTALIGAAALAPALTWAEETCYDFSRQTVGQDFHIGDTVQAQHLRVHFTDYMRDGVKAKPGPDSQFVRIQATTLAGGTAPELYTYLATMRIQPHSPVAQLRMRVGESLGGALHGHANLEFNGTVHEVTGRLAQLDGREFGNAAMGRVRIEASLAQRSGTRYDGTLRVRALSGRIASFGLGGAALAVDDVCFAPEAPTATQ
jgi:hypothetical protein